MNSKQSRFNLVLLGIVAVGILMLVIGLFVLQQQYGNTRRLQAEKNKLDGELQKVNEALADRKKLDDELTKINQDLATLGPDIAAYEYMPTYLQRLQKDAVDTGNSIRSIQPREVHALDLKNSPLAADNGKGKEAENMPPPAPPAKSEDDTAKTKKPSYQVQQITLEIEGDYPNLLRFLDKLRSFPKMVYVRGVAVSPQHRDNEHYLRTRLETYAIIIPSQYKGGPAPKKGR